MNPIVSVIIPAYNHEAFVKKAVESVLNQTYKDFELIIVDDCSPDKTYNILKTIKDDRISLYKNEVNSGAVETFYRGLSAARGKYIALLNSDDFWVEDKLQTQVDFLENNNNIHAVFSDASFVDENDTILTKDEFAWTDTFKVSNKTSNEWLNHFYYYYNCICHPSMLIRKDVITSLPPYDLRLRQLPDFKMWINFVKKYNLHIMPDKLVCFRILKNEANSSSDSVENRIRVRNEMYFIFNEFFDNVSIENFKDAFHDKLIHKDITTDIEMKCEQAFIYFTVENELKGLFSHIGLCKLYELMGNDVSREVLKEKYSFGDREFFKLTTEINIENLSGTTITTVVKQKVAEQIPDTLKIKIKRYFGRLTK